MNDPALSSPNASLLKRPETIPCVETIGQSKALGVPQKSTSSAIFEVRLTHRKSESVGKSNRGRMKNFVLCTTIFTNEKWAEPSPAIKANHSSNRQLADSVRPIRRISFSESIDNSVRDQRRSWQLISCACSIPFQCPERDARRNQRALSFGVLFQQSSMFLELPLGSDWMVTATILETLRFDRVLRLATALRQNAQIRVGLRFVIQV